MKVFREEYEAAIKYVEENNPAAHPVTGHFNAKEALDSLLKQASEDKLDLISSGGFHVRAESYYSDQLDTLVIELSSAFDVDYDDTFEV